MHSVAHHLLRLSLISALALLTACSHVSKQKPWPAAKEEMEGFVDRFVNECVGRDIVKDPYPGLGTNFYHKYSPGIGNESFRGQCTFGKFSIRHLKYSIKPSFNKSYFTYHRRQEFLDIVKSRFGVIYHDSSRFITGCIKGELHDLLLRDGKTHLIVQYVNDYGNVEGCYQTYWQGTSLQLNLSGLNHSEPTVGKTTLEDGTPAYSNAPLESHIVKRIDVLNKDMLTELEKRELAMRYEQLSEEEKKQRMTEIAHEIRMSKNNLDFWAQERQDMINLQRTARRRERAREKAFLNQLDQQLAQGFAGLQQQVIEKQRDDHRRALQNQVAQQTSNIPSDPARQVSVSRVFSNLEGFDTAQLDENITYQEEADPQVTASSYPSQNSRENQGGKAATSKVYEPAPEVIERETDSWFSDRNLAIAYARLKATNDIKDVCRSKDARSDTVTFSQIKAGNPPVRWDFSAPQCRQGGWQDEEWKCQARVSGTCFRNQ